jgi:hypothetical protein
METERLDCDWCGSAQSIEYGLCQVCLMEYPMDTRIIQLPLERPSNKARIVDLEEKERTTVAE